LHDGRELKHLWVHIERRQRARGDDDACEPVKYRRNSDRRVKARQVEDRVRDCLLLGLKRLKNEQEAYAE
jgi:hypothetical protein